MKHVRIILLALLASSLSILCLAQQPGEIAKRKFKHRGQIDSSYDASSNKTTVVLNPYQISANAADEGETKEYFSIMCGFIYQGRTMTDYPETIEFHIISDGTRGFKFDDDKKRTLTIEIDGERIRLGTMTLVRSKHFAFGSSPVNRFRNGYLEELSIILTYQGLLKIAEGKKVWLFVAQHKIDLDHEHMEALRDLASRINL